MTVQVLNGIYASGVPTVQTMNPNYMNSYKQICMKFQQIEFQNYMNQFYHTCDNSSQLSLSQNNNSSTNSNSMVSDKKYTIAVVDFCDNSDSDIDLDGDGKGDMAHGNVVANLIKATFKNSDVYTFDITQNSAGTTNERLVASLESIINELKSGTEKYDALNMSLSSRITYSALSKALGKTITKDNVSQYQSEIRNWLLTQGSKNGYTTTAKVVQLIEQIEALGCDVYIAAANVNDGTDDELNLYTIANNTTSVGALSKSGGKASFSFDNSMIDTWALGEIEVKKVKDSSGKLLGYDLNNDGVVDINGSFTSGGANSANPFLRGTSFASPYKLIQDLK